ncbi:MAG: hypothetical protein N7Q72_05680, partial [Spiroplasma sp. Tabriz.8]|nr:hypothetical protein [Spiroplasma sp. Tabriz.8]
QSCIFDSDLDFFWSSVFFRGHLLSLGNFILGELYSYIYIYIYIYMKNLLKKISFFFSKVLTKLLKL